jgi:hypothetical protein
MVNSQKISKRFVGGDGFVESASNVFRGVVDRVRNTYVEYNSTFNIGLIVIILLVIIFVIIFVPKAGGPGAIDDTVYAKSGVFLSDVSGQVTPDGNVILVPEPEKYVSSNSFTVFMQLCINNINTNLTKDRNILLMPTIPSNTRGEQNMYSIGRNSLGKINTSPNGYTNIPSSNPTGGETNNFYLHIYLSKFKNDIIVKFKRTIDDIPSEVVITNIPISKWFSIAVCRNNTTLHVYVDGKPYQSKFITTNSIGQPGRAHPIYIGKGINLDSKDNTTFDTLDGVIASIIVNNSAKSRDVIENYNRGLSTDALLKPTLIKESTCTLESSATPQ